METIRKMFALFVLGIVLAIAASPALAQTAGLTQPGSAVDLPGHEIRGDK